MHAHPGPARASPLSCGALPAPTGCGRGYGRGAPSVKDADRARVRTADARTRARFVAASPDRHGLRRIARSASRSAGAAGRRNGRRAPAPPRGTISTHRPSERHVRPRREGNRPPMPSLTESAVIDAMRTVQEPELGRDIVTLDMVKNVVIDGDGDRLHDRADDARLSAQGRDRGQRPGGPRRHRGRDRSTSPGARWSAGPQPRQAEQLVPGRQEHHRRRVRQGRRRQEHGQRQPRGRARPGRRVGRAARRRHHRTEHPDDAGPRGPAEGEREQQDHAARALRRQGHLDPVLRPGGPADRLARAARRRRHPAVPARRRVGRARLPRHRPAARHVRCPADARPGRPDLGRRARDDAAGGRAVGRRQGARDVQADERARSSASSRT